MGAVVDTAAVVAAAAAAAIDGPYSELHLLLEDSQQSGAETGMRRRQDAIETPGRADLLIAAAAAVAARLQKRRKRVEAEAGAAVVQKERESRRLGQRQVDGRMASGRCGLGRHSLTPARRCCLSG